MTYPDPPPLPVGPDWQDLELLFVVRVDEIIAQNARWSAARHDVRTILHRYADQRSTIEERIDTVCWVYGAPLRPQDGQPTEDDRAVFRERMKHLRAKYPEFLPLAERRIPTHLTHERES